MMKEMTPAMKATWESVPELTLLGTRRSLELPAACIVVGVTSPLCPIAKTDGKLKTLFPDHHRHLFKPPTSI